MHVNYFTGVYAIDHNGYVKENNFLGRGIAFISDLEISNSTLRGIISLENPNYQGTNRSLSTTLESTVTDRLKNFGYKSNKTGFSIGSGFEFYDDLFLTTGVSVYTETIKTDSTASATLLKQKGSYFDTYFNYSFDYDKRNQKYQPSAGFRSKFNQNLPIISESYTVKNFYNFSQYNEWSNENISSLGFYLGNSMSLNGKDIKLSDRLYKKIRGFESGKIGPKDGDDFVGGNYAFAINAGAKSVSEIKSRIFLFFLMLVMCGVLIMIPVFQIRIKLDHQLVWLLMLEPPLVHLVFH